MSWGVDVVTGPLVELDDRFARELPELAVPWRADVAPDPRLLVLNEPLAVELGFDPGRLRSPEGLLLRRIDELEHVHRADVAEQVLRLDEVIARVQGTK